MLTKILENEKQIPGFNRLVKQVSRIIMHSGKKLETDDIDDEIVEWILITRNLGITVTIWEVIVKASTVKEQLKKKLEFSPKVVLSVLVRNHLTFRVGTNIGQENPENYKEKMF